MVNPSLTPESEEQYVELFCLVTFTDDDELDKGFYLRPCREIDDPKIAEVCIPHREPGKLYGITCYITNAPNWQPVLGAMVFLQDFFEKSFSAVLDVFNKNSALEYVTWDEPSSPD